MNSPTQTIDSTRIRDYMMLHLGQVFETMLAMKPNPASAVSVQDETERVTGSVGFAGETINGSVYLHLSARFAALAASVMFCGDAQNLAESEINDAIGELTNMLAGGLKSWLCDAGADCAVSTPAIIRGRSFAIEHAPDVERIQLGFESGTHRFCVEVHFKLN